MNILVSGDVDCFGCYRGALGNVHSMRIESAKNEVWRRKD